jgi:2-C-methyl-D-erythritol 4-phosphate cytidylyltransferase/2-C-methyl-D-erythritol 2,4-cyclodiphosphate synthase
MTTAVIIVAAGRGTRAGGEMPKQWQLLAGKPLVAHAIAAFRGVVDLCLVAVHPDDLPQAAPLGAEVVTGGATRQETVLRALLALVGRGITRVLIHDAARPMVPPQVIRAVLRALDTHQGAAPALPVTDALWRGDSGLVSGTAPRDGLWRAQTPQGFHFDAILAAHQTHRGGAADDVEVARAAGVHVAIVAGDDDSLKITYPGDLARAETIYKERHMDIRLGNGFDVHAFTTGDSVVLCGVSLPHDRALLGHSDADVGMHALTDAIYGALALGDIGVHFPPSDPQWKGAASDIFLKDAVAQMRNLGFALANADVTLICERPKIGPHQGAMRESLARIMGVDVARISVKATTSERLGFTGREEGIACIATAALVRA